MRLVCQYDRLNRLRGYLPEARVAGVFLQRRGALPDTAVRSGFIIAASVIKSRPDSGILYSARRTSSHFGPCGRGCAICLRLRFGKTRHRSPFLPESAKGAACRRRVKFISPVIETGINEQQRCVIWVLFILRFA